MKTAKSSPASAHRGGRPGVPKVWTWDPHHGVGVHILEKNCLGPKSKSTRSHGGATTTGPDATYPPAICQNSGGGGRSWGGGVQPGVGGVQPGVGGGVQPGVIWVVWVAIYHYEYLFTIVPTQPIHLYLSPRLCSPQKTPLLYPSLSKCLSFKRFFFAVKHSVHKSISIG